METMATMMPAQALHVEIMSALREESSSVW